MLLKIISHLRFDKVLNTRYPAIVVENIDPKKLGRIKVKCPGKFETDDVEKLPWCYPLVSPGLGGLPDLSGFSVPELYSKVNIVFPYEDIYSPFYIGANQDDQTHQTLFDENYPESYGHIDSTVQWLKVNKAKPDFELFRQTIGDMFRVDQNGDWSINIPRDLIINIGRNLQLNVTSDFNAKAITINTQSTSYNDLINGIKNIKTTGNFNIVVGGKKAEAITGDIGVSSGGTVDISATSGMALSGTSFNWGTSPTYTTASDGATELSGWSLTAAMITLSGLISALLAKVASLNSLAASIKSASNSIKTTLQNLANSLRGD